MTTTRAGYKSVRKIEDFFQLQIGYGMSKNTLVNNEDLRQKATKHSCSAFKLYNQNALKEALSEFAEANKIFTSFHDMENISICLSWMSLINYKINPNNYYKIIIMLNDAKFLAENSSSKLALFHYYYASGSINFLDENYAESLYHLDKAKNLSEGKNDFDSQIYILLAKIFEMNEQYEKAYIHWNLALQSSNLNKKESTVVTENIKRLKKYREDINKNKAVPELQEAIPATPDKDPLIALLKIARTVSAQTDIDVLLKTIAEITKNALEADRCTVFLHDKEKNELWSKVALGLGTEELRFPADRGLAGHVVTTGETVIINDAYTDARFNKDIDLQTGYRTQTILCMPIRNIKHEIVGVFQVLNKLNNTFTEHDEDLLIAIGSSAGIALENARLFKHQQELFDQQTVLFASFIDTLVASIDARDKSTSGHSSRVKMYSRLMCSELGFDPKQIEVIEHAAILHDIGKIGIRDSVLQKDGKLTNDEYAHIQLHVNITYDILSKIYLSKNMADVAEIASAHHERFDGKGYFRNRKGDAIPIGGRILAVADVFDAVTSHRHYRDKMPIKNALEVLVSGAGSQFDDALVRIFMDITLDKIVKVFLAEFEVELLSKDENTLKGYTLSNLYDIIIKVEGCASKNAHDEVDNDEAELIDIFNKYYTYKSILS